MRAALITSPEIVYAPIVPVEISATNTCPRPSSATYAGESSPEMNRPVQFLTVGFMLRLGSDPEEQIKQNRDADQEQPTEKGNNTRRGLDVDVARAKIAGEVSDLLGKPNESQGKQ